MSLTGIDTICARLMRAVEAVGARAVVYLALPNSLEKLLGAIMKGLGAREVVVLLLVPTEGHRGHHHLYLLGIEERLPEGVGSLLSMVRRHSRKGVEIHRSCIHDGVFQATMLDVAIPIGIAVALEIVQNVLTQFDELRLGDNPLGWPARSLVVAVLHYSSNRSRRASNLAYSGDAVKAFWRRCFSRAMKSSNCWLAAFRAFLRAI